MCSDKKITTCKLATATEKGENLKQCKQAQLATATGSKQARTWKSDSNKQAHDNLNLGRKEETIPSRCVQANHNKQMCKEKKRACTPSTSSWQCTRDFQVKNTPMGRWRESIMMVQFNFN